MPVVRITHKVDNRSLATKIDIRRRLLALMHFDEITVLDTCAGMGHVWSAMEEHVTIRQWTRCDIKPKRTGTLSLSAVQSIRSLPLAAYNVIDIDPYGEPWDPYLELLPRLTRPVAVFLTRGHIGIGVQSILAATMAGIPEAWVPDLPRTPSIGERFGERILSFTHLHATIAHALTVAAGNGRGSSVTYYALGLIPHRAESDL